MKAGVPWSVKGIEPETRAAAKAAARRAGLTLGEWLSQKINETDDGDTAASLRRSLDAYDPYGADLGGGHERPRQSHAASFDWAETSPTLSVVMDRLSRLETEQKDAIHHVESAVQALAQRLQSATSGQRAEGPALERRVAKLELDGAIRQTRLDNTLEGIVERSDALDAKLTKIDGDSRAAAQTFEAVFTAVAKRLGTIERRQSEHADLLEQAVGRLSEGLADIVQRETAGGLGAVRTLEHAVEEITRHFETLETRREATQKLVESALGALADRIAEADLKLTKTGATPAEAIDRAVARMQTRLQETEKQTADALAAFDARLQALSGQLQESAIAPAPVTPDPAPKAFAAEEAELPEPEPVTLAELASDIIAHDHRRSAARERVDGWEEAVAPASEPIADAPPAQAQDFQPEPAKPELSEDIHALLGAARLIARADDPTMAKALPEAPDDFPDLPPEPPLDTEAPAQTDATNPTLGALTGVATHERRRAHAEVRARERRQKRLAVALGLLAGAALGGLLLVSYGGGNDKLSATRPGLVMSLVDALRSASERTLAKVERLIAPEPPAPRQPEVGPQPQVVPPARGTAAEPATPLPPLSKRAVGTVPPPPLVGPPDPAPSATPKAPGTDINDVHASAVEAIKALKAARTVNEEAAAAKRVGRAAALGDADAQFALGRLYETGRSVTHDTDAARRWYTEAARGGNAEASFNLGMMEIARGGEGAYERAANYFRTAAEAGNVDAQVNLALLYEQGLGVPRDDALALDWYAKAALRGDPEATRARDRLARRGGGPAR